MENDDKNQITSNYYGKKEKHCHPTTIHLKICVEEKIAIIEFSDQIKITKKKALKMQIRKQIFNTLLKIRNKKYLVKYFKEKCKYIHYIQRR